MKTLTAKQNELIKDNLTAYCHKNNFEISAEDEDIIRARGLGGWFDDWKYEQEKYND